MAQRVVGNDPILRKKVKEMEAELTRMVVQQEQVQCQGAVWEATEYMCLLKLLRQQRRRGHHQTAVICRIRSLYKPACPSPSCAPPCQERQELRGELAGASKVILEICLQPW